MTGKQTHFTQQEYEEMARAVDSAFRSLESQEANAPSLTLRQIARRRNRRLLRAWERVQDIMTPNGPTMGGEE